MGTGKVILACVVLVEVALLLSGFRVLVWEIKVPPGETYIASGHGTLRKNPQSSLVCKYFTGRSVTESVFWYSSNNIMGRDSCAFIYKP